MRAITIKKQAMFLLDFSISISYMIQKRGHDSPNNYCN
ncbi:hypothetical protein bcere0020_22510 [Bacillus cereus Rock3-29]|nr:hypothetical protein bcere0020_22510 [Bacillus cereus Rock3-29]